MYIRNFLSLHSQNDMSVGKKLHIGSVTKKIDPRMRANSSVPASRTHQHSGLHRRRLEKTRHVVSGMDPAPCQRTRETQTRSNPRGNDGPRPLRDRFLQRTRQSPANRTPPYIHTHHPTPHTMEPPSGFKIAGLESFLSIFEFSQQKPHLCDEPIGASDIRFCLDYLPQRCLLLLLI